MTDRCEPPEHLRGVAGWHWVRWPEGPPQLLRWRYVPRMEAHGWTLRTYSTTADGATRAGWRYLAPAATPEEVAALRADGRVVAKVPDHATPETVPWRYGDEWVGIQDGASEESLDLICKGYADGWNACRAAMLASSEAPNDE